MRVSWCPCCCWLPAEVEAERRDIAEQLWDCMAENADDPEVFEQSMLMMLPTASNLEEAKEMYIYVSSAAPMDELKAGRDEACGSK